MAKNDIILIDGIVEERVAQKYPSAQVDEVFEFLAFEELRFALLLFLEV